MLDRCREVYNSALQERRDAYELAVRRHPNYYDEETRKQLTCVHAVDSFKQKRELVEVKEERPEYKDIASHVLQDVILRLKHAFDGFFRRVQNRETPGYPRFKGKNRYHSFCYPDHAGWKLVVKEQEVQGKPKHKAILHLSKIGTAKVVWHQKLVGKLKTCTIKREIDQWSVVLTAEVEDEVFPLSEEQVGIDLGVTHLGALSDGSFIDHPRYFRRTQKKLAAAQRAKDRKKKGSHRQRKAKRQKAVSAGRTVIHRSAHIRVSFRAVFITAASHSRPCLCPFNLSISSCSTSPLLQNDGKPVASSLPF